MKIQPIFGPLEESEIHLIMSKVTIMSAFKNRMEQWTYINMLMVVGDKPIMFSFQITLFLDLSGLVVVHHQTAILLKLYIQFLALLLVSSMLGKFSKLFI
jgi:hypothetical protein